jgi:hypothetical protein
MGRHRIHGPPPTPKGAPSVHGHDRRRIREIHDELERLEERTAILARDLEDDYANTLDLRGELCITRLALRHARGGIERAMGATC